MTIDWETFWNGLSSKEIKEALDKLPQRSSPWRFEKDSGRWFRYDLFHPFNDIAMIYRPDHPGGENLWCYGTSWNDYTPDLEFAKSKFDEYLLSRGWILE